MLFFMIRTVWSWEDIFWAFDKQQSSQKHRCSFNFDCWKAEIKIVSQDGKSNIQVFLAIPVDAKIETHIMQNMTNEKIVFDKLLAH